MKITKVTIQNFLNLRNVELDFSEGRVLVVGANGSGKTNILKCISTLLKDATNDPSRPRPVSYNVEPAAEIHFQLSPKERSRIMVLRAIFITENILHYCPVLAGERFGVKLSFPPSSAKEHQIIEQLLKAIVPKLLEDRNTEVDSRHADVTIFCESSRGSLLSSPNIRLSGMLLPDNRTEEKEAIMQGLEEVFHKMLYDGVPPDYRSAENEAIKQDLDKVFHTPAVDTEDIGYEPLSLIIDKILCHETFLKLQNNFVEKNNSQYACQFPQRTAFVSTYSRATSLFPNLDSGSSARTLYECVLQLVRGDTYILPQSRGSLESEVGPFFWDMEKAEANIIAAYLSEKDGEKASLLKDIKESLLRITGLEMDVTQGGTPFSNVNVSSPSVCLTNSKLHVVLRPLTKHKSEWRSLESCSGGERELLMVLSAVNLSGATNVYLDEPGHSLHPPKQAQLRRWLETRSKSDQVIFAITHSTEMISPQWLGSLYHMHLEEDGNYTACCLREKQETESKFEKKKSGKRRKHGQSSHTSVTDESHGDESEEEPAVKIRRLSRKELSSDTISFLMGAEMRRLFFSAGVIFVEGNSDKRVIQSLRYVALQEANKVLESNQSRIEDWCDAYLETRMDRWDIISMNGCAEWLKAYSAAESLGIPFLILLDADVLTAKCGSCLLAMTFDGWEKSLLRRSIDGSEYKFNKSHQLTKMVDAVNVLANSRKPDVADLVRDEIKKCHVWVLENDLEHWFFKNENTQKRIMEKKKFQEVLKSLQLTSSNQPDSYTPRDQPGYRTPGAQQTEGINACFDKFDQSFKDIHRKFTELIDDMGKSADYTEKHVTELAKFIMCKAGEVKQKLMNYNKSQRVAKKDSSENEKLDWSSLKKKLHDGGWKNVSFELLNEMVKAAYDNEDDEYWHKLSDDKQGFYDKHGLHALWKYVKDRLITEKELDSIPPFVFDKQLKRYLVGKKT